MTTIARNRYRSCILLILVGTCLQPRCPRCVPILQSSYSLVPNSRVLYNIGMCPKALDRFTDAYITFQQYLRVTGDAQESTLHHQIERALVDLETTVAFLAITESPPDAQSIVDDKTAVRLPSEAPYPVAPGEHLVIVSNSEHPVFEDKITVSPGETKTIPISQDPAAPSLFISCVELDRATVHVDGALSGTCPYAGTVSPGKHAPEIDTPERERSYGEKYDSAL